MNVSAIARFGLGSYCDPIEPPLDSQAKLLGEIERHRISGVAVRAVESDMLRLDAVHAESLFARHDAVMIQTLRVEQVLVHVAAALSDHGVTFRVLKGSALAHTVAVDCADREFRDVDLLIPADQLAHAVGVVESLGGGRYRSELRPDFDRRFAKSVTMRLDGVEVDLHRTLASGPFGVWICAGDLFVLSGAFTIAGTTLPTLDPTDHLLHACVHAALGQTAPALTNLRDIVLLAERTRWDPERFGETVTRWQAAPAIARAVRLVEDQLGVDLPPALTTFEEQPGDADVLRPYAAEGDRFAGLAAATLWVLPPTDRIAFARAIGFPSDRPSVERARELLRSKRWRELRSD